MRYRYLDDFRRGISVFAIFSYGIAVLVPPNVPLSTTEAKIENDLIRSRCFMNQFTIELDWKFTLSLTPTPACS